MSSNTLAPTSAAIALLNDAFRQTGPSKDWMVTDGVVDRGGLFTALAFQRVMRFDTFAPNNDPYGEHDFGAFTIDGEKLFWKIDYYDESYQWASPDPADASCTRRVLTIMLSREW